MTTHAADAARSASTAAPPRASGAPDWAVDGADWPHRTSSAFVMAGGLSWHVQEMAPVRPDDAAGHATTPAGDGAVGDDAARIARVLMLHGTGASTHSFEGLLPLIGARCHVLAPDLPGHGFTSATDVTGIGIRPMGRLVGRLLETVSVQPDVVIGHSAGAALLIRMTLDGLIAPRAIVSLNGALLPFAGVGRTLFPTLARMLFLNPFVPQFFAWQGQDRARVARLLDNTGSRLTDRQVDLYARLMRHPRHISGALGMMANWNLAGLEADLGRLATPLVLLVGQNDRTIPPADAAIIKRRTPDARIVRLPGLGHLAHEEAPEAVFSAIAAALSDLGLMFAPTSGAPIDVAAQRERRDESMTGASRMVENAKT